MSAELQPFESHPASPGDLQAGANNLVQQGAEALQNADQTEIAYSPASDAVTGEPAPAIAVASDPVKARSLASSESLVWAGVAMKMWSEKVRDFNQQVEVIKYERMAAMLAADEAAGNAVATGGADPAAAAQEADAAKVKADEVARSRWHRVYTEQIIGGRSLVQSWLRQGPTDNNLQAARLLNVMPDLRWGPLEALWKGVLGIGGNDVSGIPPIPPGGALGPRGGRGRGLRGIGAGGAGSRAVVDAGKYDYLFGRVASDSHNAARSAQNARQLARIGVHDDDAGRSLLSRHFDEVVARDDNVVRTYTNEHGTFQARDSLFAGPGGFLKFESTWQVTNDGPRLTTVIPIGGS